MKSLTNAQLKKELDRRYAGGYILVGAEKDPLHSEKPGYQLWLHCFGSAMCYLLEYACREYKPLKMTAKDAVKGKNGFKESMKKALINIEKDRNRE